MLRNLGTRMALQIALVIFLVVSVTGVITFIRVSRAVEETTARRFSETVARGAEHAGTPRQRGVPAHAVGRKPAGHRSGVHRSVRTR